MKHKKIIIQLNITYNLVHNWCDNYEVPPLVLHDMFHMLVTNSTMGFE